MPFKKGQPSANPNGRATAPREKSFYTSLDTVGIPKSLDQCIAVLDGTHPKLAQVHDSSSYIRLQLEAAKILMSKAPDRLQAKVSGGWTVKTIDYSQVKKNE